MFLFEVSRAKDQTKTEIYVRKVRFKSEGKIGVTELRWDRATGRYSEIAAPAGNSGRGYVEERG
jgi:hypothetical protein